MVTSSLFSGAQDERQTAGRLSVAVAVETLFASSGLVSRHEQDGFTLGIKGESDSPLTVCRAESQLLHIGMPRAIERVNAGPTQLWPKLLQNERQSENLRLHVFMQSIEFR